MKIIPDTREEWQSIVKTSVKGGALIFDKLFTGGSLQFLVGLGIEKRNSKALLQLKEISLALKEEIQNKIDLVYIKSDEFMIFISDAMSEALKVKNIEKIGYFRSAIINGMIRRDMEESKKLLFLDALSNLSIGNLSLLKLVDDMSSSVGEARFNFSQIQQRANNIEPNFLMAQIKALERYHLVESVRPGIIVDNYANYLVVYGNFGRDFISFIMQYGEDS